jgi:hypothetical protein
MLGTENLHDIGSDVSGLAVSTDNFGVKSVSFTLFASNPRAAGTVWFNGSSGILNLGSEQIISSAATQTLTYCVGILYNDK